MKITCLSQNLAEGLSTVNRVCTTSGSLPVLSHILISTDEGRLRVAGTNLEISISNLVNAKVEKEGAITVPANVISELITSLPDQKIELSTEKMALHVKGEGVDARLNGIPAEEFPELPLTNEEPFFEVALDELVPALKKVVFAAAKDESRPVLTGVLTRLEGDNLVLVAVDGFRLSEKKIKVEGINAADFSWADDGVVIPSRAFKELIRIGKGSTVKLTVETGEGRAIFEFGDVRLASRLLEGSFPEYDKIIPEGTALEGTVERDEFQKGVSLAAIFARGSSSIVKIKSNLEEGKLILSANTADIGENTVETAIEDSEGEDLKVAFNSNYLSECFTSLDCGKVRLAFSGSIKPLVIRMAESDDFLHLIMPVRVQE